MNLKLQLMQSFGLTSVAADRHIAEASARADIKRAIAAAQQGQRIKRARADFESPGEWRTEVQRRTIAVNVLREGIKAMRKLHRIIEMVLEREEKMLQHKTAQINDQQVDWWNFRDSGWAMGGREAFVQMVCDVFTNLDEAKLGQQVLTKLGFQRSVPLPELPVEPEPAPHERVERSILGV